MGFNEELQDLIRRYKSGSATIIGIDQLKQDIEALTDAYVNNANQDEKIIKDLSISLKNARRELARKAAPDAKSSFTGAEPPLRANLKPHLSGFDRLSANDPEFMSKLGSDYYQNASTAQKKQITQAVNLRRKIAQQNEAITSFTEDSGPFASETHSVAALRSQRDEAQIKLNKLEKKLGVNATTASGSPILDAVISNQPKVNVPTKPVKTAEQLADEAAQAAVDAEKKRLKDKLMGKTGPKQEIATTANSDILSDAASNYVSRDYDSNAKRRSMDKAERAEMLKERSEKLRADNSAKHIARMSVQQMEWDEKNNAKDTGASIKGADAAIKAENALEQKRLADAQKNDEALIKQHQKYLAEQEMLNDRGAAEARAYYAKQETDDARHIAHVTELANKHNEEMRKQDEKTVNDERRHIAHLTEMGNKHNEDIKKQDAQLTRQQQVEQERRNNAMQQSLQAQATTAHRVGMGISMGISYPLFALGKASIKATESMSKITAGMEATMGSAQAAKSEIERLAAVATLPGLNFKDLVQGSLTLQNTGMTAAGAEKTVRAFGNALAKAGKGSEELKGVELALQQIMSKGKLVGQELRQLQERLPMIRQMSEKAFGTADSQELTKRGIGAQEYILGIVAALEQETKVPDNFANAMKNLTNEIFLFQDAVGKALAPAITSTANQLTKMTRTFRDMSPAAQTMGVQVAALAAGSGPLLLLTSQILQIQVATAAWRKEMLAATGQAMTMGQVISNSVAGKMGIAALGVGVGVLGGTLIAGNQTRSSTGELTDSQYKRSILAGGLTGLLGGAGTGYMLGNAPGAIIGGTVGAIGGMLAAKYAAQPVDNNVPENRKDKMFAETGVDKNADEIREAFSKNADKERSAWYANKLLGVDASVRPNKYGHVSPIDQAKAEIEKAKYKYAQDMQELTNLQKDAIVARDAAQKHYNDLYEKNAQLTANENRKLTWFDPRKAKADDPVLKQYNEDTVNQNSRIEILKAAQDYVNSLNNQLATFDDTTRKQLIANQKYAAITKAQDTMRLEELRVSKVEKTAMKDASLAVAIYGQSDIAKQKITALDTYNRTIEDLTELYENGENVTNRCALAMAAYQSTMYTVNEAEADLAKQENRSKAHASDIMLSVGQENELVTQEIEARRNYWDTMEDLTKDYKKGIDISGRYALAKAAYEKQHYDIMKADAIDKRTMAAATEVNALEMYALQQEMGTIGSDLLKDTDPYANADDYNKYWAARARIESSAVQRNVAIQNTPASKRIPNAQALSDVQYNAERIALDKSWIKSDKDRTDKTAANILSRIKLNREEADKYSENMQRMRDEERQSMQHLGSGSELWMNASVLGAQQRLNGPTNSSTLWNRGQQPEFWEIVKALKDITDEARRLADATEFTKQMGSPSRPAPAYPNSLSVGAA